MMDSEDRRDISREGISRRLRDAIMRSGKTRSELDELAELGDGVVEKYTCRKFKSLPTAYTLAKLCRALGVSADEILGLKED